MKIHFRFEVILYNRFGYIEHVWPARTHKSAVMLADLWILKERRKKKKIKKQLAAISVKDQILDTKVNGLGKVSLIENGRRVKTFRMYNSMSGYELGRMWASSGLNRSSRSLKFRPKVISDVVKKQMDKQLSLRRAI